MSISTQIVVIMTIMTNMTIISIPDSGVNCGDLLCPLLCRALHQDLLLLLHQEHQVSHQISSHHHQLIRLETNPPAALAPRRRCPTGRHSVQTL